MISAEERKASMYRANLALFMACGLVATTQVPNSKQQISGPYTHQNLSVFFVHGRSGAVKYLSLKEALDQKKVVVHETGQVNELAVENISNQAVFLQGGDIVRGGQQDRVISNDFVLPPKSGRLPVAAFCVELGRWKQRGNESAASFNSSREMAASLPVKLAALAEPNQASVWGEIEKLQAVLARKVGLGDGVRARQSPSSLALTLESAPMEQAVRGYVEALNRAVDGKSDVVGVVFAVNGEANSGDVYASHELFASMWPKVLKAGAVEAVRVRSSGKFTAAGTPAIEAFLSAGERGTEWATEVDRRIKLVKRESDREVSIESQERGAWVHRSYIKK